MTSIRENKAWMEQGLLALKDAKSRLSVASVEGLIAIIDEIARLRTENEELRTQATAKATEAIGLIQHSKNEADSAKAESLETKKQLDTVKAEKKDTEKKLAKVEAELRQSIEKASGLEAKYRQEQQELEAELRDRDEELEELREHSVELKEVAENKEELYAALETIRTEAIKLALTYFGMELQLGTDDDLWKKAKAQSTGMPKPRSSPDLARRMRVALMLSVVARELCQHVFQPAYLSEQVRGIDSFLRDLAKRDPEQESHLRSVLLKTENPAKTRIGSMNRWVDQLVHDSFDGISKVASTAIPNDKVGEFEADLLRLCETAYEKWRFIQTLKNHIRPDFAIGFSLEQEEDKWSPLPSTVPSPLQSPKAKQQRANGTASAQATPKKSQPSAGNPAELSSIVVWPAFVNASRPEEGALSKGLVLPRSLIDAVKEDWAAASASPTSSKNPHREMRAEARNRDSATQKKRRSSTATVNGNGADSKQKGPTSASNGHGSGPNGA
ncbi:hypothetical protein MYCTH_2131220 [Thermothelomyces thermophilus ATCC 42464]|uniref:Uncharacterized protein n=1 Tax=Thermothelomyces thermophilus (strain ATCC 42464 / BCRC 31852 / DSM 1799) TaxID=573729 RepID=G2QNG6_THET4|nr:uncharacterized protein MYCTH_2131220 [Thermothelomyces thermophilus ATCC 42464]AEO62039.1 hypothetical protein MYCTH_2131220 [Thermothelomyces thermophilus ATCC 42464]